MKQKITNRSIWKWAFILLLALNISFGVVIASRVFTPTKAQVTRTKQQNSIEVGSFTTTRENLNQTVASYLEAYQTKQFSYQLTATSEELVFEGSYQLLGHYIPLYLYMEPSVSKTGAVNLRVTSVAAGSLSLPKKEVLQYIASSYKLPKIVSINAKKGMITLNLPELDNDLGIYLKAEQIDLVDNDLKFTIYKKNASN